MALRCHPSFRQHYKRSSHHPHMRRTDNRRAIIFLSGLVVSHRIEPPLGSDCQPAKLRQIPQRLTLPLRAAALNLSGVTIISSLRFRRLAGTKLHEPSQTRIGAAPGPARGR